MKKIIVLLTIILGLFMITPVQAAAPAGPNLIMIHNPSCSFCKAFMRDLNPNYGKTEDELARESSQNRELYYSETEIGKAYPLVVLNIRISAPEWFFKAVQDGKVNDIKGTPTFILWDGDKEFGRIEGYGGREWFFEKLEALTLRYKESREIDRSLEESK